MSQITKTGTWYTREQLGNKFRKPTTSKKVVEFTPPELIKYAKLASANQTGLLSANYSQTCSAPVFGGYRTQKFTDNFFAQVSKRTGVVATAKTIPQITASLTELLEELRRKLFEDGKRMEVGTVHWHNMDSLMCGNPGRVDLEYHPKCDGLFFLGRSD